MPSIDFYPRNWPSGKSWEARGVLGSGAIHYMRGSRRWRATLNARSGDSVMLLDEEAGTPRAALSKLQRALDAKAGTLWGSGDPVRLTMHKTTAPKEPTA